MKKLLVCLTILGFVFVGIGLSMAGNSAQQTVSFSTAAINEITVSGNPPTLTINTATAGQQPDEVSDSSTTYSITTNGSNKKITGALDSNMPQYTTLKANLAAPTGGTSAGDVTLSATSANLVTGISTLAEQGKTITYKFSAQPEAGTSINDSRVVTFTLTDG